MAHLVEIVALQFDGDRAQLRQAAQRVLVAQGQPVRAHSGVLVGDRGDGAVPHHDDVVAEGGERAVLAGAESLAESHQHQQRANPPGDAEHGEKAAQLVGRDGAEDLAEDVCEGLHRG